MERVQTQATAEVRREQIHPLAHSRIATISRLQHCGLRRASVLQTEFKQIEKHPAAFVAPHRQREQKIHRVKKAANHRETDQHVNQEHQAHGNRHVEYTGKK